MTADEKYMARCIQLARNGFYGAAPNPMVGAVIVRRGRIIGEGYHVRCGGPHAEVNAVRSVEHPEWLADSTLYVSLEPCSHYGRTPPCADMIVERGIPRVVVDCMDPFARVAGRGIAKLREAGVEVKVGVLEEECRALNRRFITFHTLRRPFITLKWAQSADGFIDTLRADYAREKAYVFSTPFSQMCMHRVRAAHQAILVGRQTALADNPALSVRLWAGRQQARVYVDASVSRAAYEGRPGVVCVRLDFGRDILPQLLDDLYGQSVQSLLVEGGRQLLEGFLAAGLWDEVRVEQSPVSLGNGVPAPAWPRGRMGVEPLDGNVLVRIFPA